MDPSREDESPFFSCRYYVTISLSLKNEKKKEERKKQKKQGNEKEYMFRSNRDILKAVLQ